MTGILICLLFWNSKIGNEKRKFKVQNILFDYVQLWTFKLLRWFLVTTDPGKVKDLMFYILKKKLLNSSSVTSGVDNMLYLMYVRDLLFFFFYISFCNVISFCHDVLVYYDTCTVANIRWIAWIPTDVFLNLFPCAILSLSVYHLICFHFASTFWNDFYLCGQFYI